MNDQQSLFDTVFVPVGEKASPSPSAPDLVHLAEGWRAVVQDMEGPGRRWLFTPWLTTRHADLLGSVQKGDRLLVRGHAEDFLKGMSSLDAVQAFIEWGVEVRRMPNLHAKVYAREHDGGLLWLGSANLSNLGEDGGAHSRQVEAMSGPHPLAPTTLTKLEYLWSNGKPFSPSDVQHELTRLVQEQETFRTLLLDQAELGVLALRLSFKLLGGQFTIPPDWLGHGNEQAQRDRVRYPSVEFIDPDTSLATRFRKFINAEKRKLDDRIEDVPGVSGLYVLWAEDMLSIRTFLSDMERQARQKFEQELHQEREHLRADFTKRFESAFQRFLSEKTSYMAKTPAQAAKLAAEAFDDHIGRDPFRISAQFFIPLKDSDDPHSGLSQAMAQVRARQRLY